MAIQIYNSLSRGKQEFTPQDQGQVKMYVCGPTVYGPSHIGHARTYIAFDVIRRYLEYSGLAVRFVCNITDVHDDMIKRASELGITIFELAEKNIASYLADMDRLNVIKADAYPRVTEHIEGIIEMTRQLVDKGYAYPSGDGSVYFSVDKFAEYGKLSGIRLEQGKTGTRVDTDKYDKDNAQDFALWKGAKQGEPSWESPWGAGRPGWHIECSVMNRQEFQSDTIDIHGGAIDLIFPHHENEIAQSEAATGHPFVRYWMHSGLLRINGEKMSKSLGNFIEIPDLLSRYDPMAVRLFLLQSHYRSSADFTDEGIEEAAKRLARWHKLLDPIGDAYAIEADSTHYNMKYKIDFAAAMDDDFNTPQAIAVMEELLKDDNLTIAQKKELVLTFDRVFGLRLAEVQSGQEFSDEQSAEIEELVQRRNQLRAEKKYAEADQVRDELARKYQVVIEDSADGTTWHIES